MVKRARGTRNGLERRLKRWMEVHYTPQRVAEAQALPLRRDLVTLLNYVESHKVTGTKSTGNMPLKAIREVTAQFVDPPLLDHKSGDRVYKLRTEDEVWPLQFLHILASVGGMLIAEPGRQWKITPVAAQFLGTDPLLQLSLLLSIWWFHVDWMVAFPFAAIGEFLPRTFEQVTLARLRAIHPGIEVPFAGFADALIRKTGLTWTAPDMSYARMSLHSAVQRMVVDILEDFGALVCTYRPHPDWPELKELDSFSITPLGVALLDSLLV